MATTQTARPRTTSDTAGLVRLPGVYQPQADTRLLASVLSRTELPPAARVLDVCTGTGALAMSAARRGCTEVTAIDISRRAVLTARLNARRLGLPARVHRRSFVDFDGTFDLVLANPPYVPATTAVPSGRARCWDAGADGRALLDPLCLLAPRLLRPSGQLLLVHSDVSGVDTTLELLRSSGLVADEVARQRNPFGPVMQSRAAFLERAGLIPAGRRYEDLVVIRAGRA
ncbi:methyltransferase [Amycolatopsis sp. 195334CR]|uniref:methyltransferase n=1 Tax=Amycolatopsis sp. 195334CR TaxID=2814588 RepID=UPI001A90CB20|nr:methyltransferase [Amycolatopsis sp. 195334CR]MBN6038373.1 methyltransferase [Amycolatopsis sp. 195334CR]